MRDSAANSTGITTDIISKFAADVVGIDIAPAVSCFDGAVRSSGSSSSTSGTSGTSGTSNSELEAAAE